MAVTAAQYALPMLSKLMGSIFGGNQSPVAGPQTAIFTPEMQQALMQNMQQYMAGQNLNYATPVSVGNVSSTQTSELSPRQIKSQNYINYLIGKGIDPQTASKQAYKNQGSYYKDKGFKEAIKEGNFQDLRVIDGKIKASPKMLGGGINISPQQQALQNTLQNFNMGALSAGMNLPTGYAQNEQRALGVRNALTNPIIGRAFSANANGLTPDSQAAVNAMIGENQRQYGDLMQQGLQKTIAELYDMGTMDSSLVPRIIDQNIGKASSDFASKSAAQMAGIYSDMLNAGQARDSQALTNQLNTYNMLGNLSGIGNVIGGVMAPTQIGGMTDAQAAQLAASMQQQNIDNRRADNTEVNKWLGTPVNLLPGQPSLGSRLLGAGASLLPYALSSIGNGKATKNA